VSKDPPRTIGNNRARARSPALAGDGGGGRSGLLAAAVGSAEVSVASPGVSTSNEPLAQLAVSLAGTKGRGGSVLAVSIIVGFRWLQASAADGDAAVILESLSRERESGGLARLGTGVSVAEGGAGSGLSVAASVAATAAVRSSVISVSTDDADGRGRLVRCVGAASGKSAEAAKRALVALAG
jgi:hypothetical protein